MNFYRRIRGHYICFRPVGVFKASLIVQLQKAMAEDLADGLYDIAIDLRKINDIDATGLRFFQNFQKALAQKEKKLVFFGPDEAVMQKVQGSGDYEVFETLGAFERSFHEIAEEMESSYFTLAKGNAGVRHIELSCPLCGNTSVKGFLLDHSKYKPAWDEWTITPVWNYQGKKQENAIDYDAYRVSVCPNCFFASGRVDWFGAEVDEGKIESSLTEEQIETLSNNLARGREFVIQDSEIRSPGFFSMPRAMDASYISWKLYEAVLRNLDKGRKHTDGFEIARCNLMMCKYTENEKLLKDHIHTATAWLTEVIKNRINYSTERSVHAFTYHISLLLYHGNLREAKEQLRTMQQEFGDEEDFSFWVERAAWLVQDEIESREAER